MVPLSSPNKAARVPVMGRNSQGRTVRESSRGVRADCVCWHKESGGAARITATARHRIAAFRPLGENSFAEPSENSREIFMLSLRWGANLQCHAGLTIKESAGFWHSI